MFIIWDIWFTAEGVWSFNEAYLTGIKIINLPLEEWMFFFTIPYACVFIYECIKAYLPQFAKIRVPQYVPAILAGIFLLLAFSHIAQRYTFITFLCLGFLLLFHALKSTPSYLGYFFLAYIIHLVPFFIVNGILTSYPVVIYNDLENLGIRLGTVPIEDPFYSMLLLLLNVNIMEYFEKRKKQRIATDSELITA